WLREEDVPGVIPTFRPVGKEEALVPEAPPVRVRVPELKLKRPKFVGTSREAAEREPPERLTAVLLVFQILRGPATEAEPPVRSRTPAPPAAVLEPPT